MIVSLSYAGGDYEGVSVFYRGRKDGREPVDLSGMIRRGGCVRWKGRWRYIAWYSEEGVVRDVMPYYVDYKDGLSR